MTVHFMKIEDFQWYSEKGILVHRLPDGSDFITKVPLPTISIQGTKHRVAFIFENSDPDLRYLIYVVKYRDLWTEEGIHNIKLHVYY